MVSASVPLTGANPQSLAAAPTQSLTAGPEAALVSRLAALVSRLGSAKSKSCAGGSSAAWLCEDTRKGQLQHMTVTPAPLAGGTAAASQIGDAQESRGTKRLFTEEKKQSVARTARGRIRRRQKLGTNSAQNLAVLQKIKVTLGFLGQLL